MGLTTTTVDARDFADAELADDAGDVAAAAVARDLARGAAIPSGGGGGRWGRVRMLIWRHRLVVATHHIVPPAAAASRPLGAPPPLVR